MRTEARYGGAGVWERGEGAENDFQRGGAEVRAAEGAEGFWADRNVIAESGVSLTEFFSRLSSTVCVLGLALRRVEHLLH